VSISSIYPATIASKKHGKSFTLLHGIPEPRDVVGQLLLHPLLVVRQFALALLRGDLVAPSVFQPAPRRHEQGQKEGHARIHISRCSVSSRQGDVAKYDDLPDKPNQDAVAGDEARAIARDVDVRGDDAAAVPAHDLHGDSGAAFEAAADVSAVPCHA